ncbi:MAG: WG repeat-containing protein [Rikenellaceae bacterium]
MKYDVFISYSSKDIGTALAICHVLESNNIRCWMAPRNIPAGADYGDVIDVAISECKIFLLLYSEPAAISPWVKGELNLAFTEGKHIIPYRIDQTPLKGAMKLMLNQRHWIDAHPNAEDEFKLLVDNICPIIGVQCSKISTPSSPVIIEDQRVEDARTFVLKIKSDSDCVVSVDGNYYIDAQCGVFTNIILQQGLHKIKFTSKLFQHVFIEYLYQITEFSSDESKKIELREKELASIPDTDIERFIENGKIGFRFRNIIIAAPKYTSTKSFSCGLAPVRQSGKYGFINKYGNIVIPCIYDKAELFSQDLAAVKLNGKVGFINKFGEVQIPFIYDDSYNGITVFNNGLACVGRDKKYGFINRLGEVVIPIIYDGVGVFSEGLAAVIINDKMGFIDNLGKTVIPLIYDNRGKNADFKDGVVLVLKDNKFGFINKLGQVVIPFKYEDAIGGGLNDGLAALKLNGKFGYVDSAGNVKIPFIYEKAGIFGDGLASVSLNEKSGAINKQGEVIIPFDYDSVGFFREGLVAVKRGGKFGYIDKYNKIVIPINLDCVIVSAFFSGVAYFMGITEAGYVDKQGNVCLDN